MCHFCDPKKIWKGSELLKSHFGPFLALIGPILGPKNFFSAPQTLSGTRCHYFQSWYAKSGKSNAFGTRKWPKISFWPLFGPNWALIGPILGPKKLFSAPQTLSGTRCHYFQSWYAKSGKSNTFGTWKWPKTSFWPLFGPNWAHFRANKFFSALWPPLATRYHNSPS